MAARLRGAMRREARSADDPYLISAALDVGTSASCYAFCYRTDEQECDIRMNTNWSEQDNFESYKTPTAVLTEPGPKGKFLEFGYAAVREYKQLTDEGKTTDKNLYHDFKMLLYTEENLNSDRTMVTSTSGTKRPLVDVFVMTLTFLREHMLRTIGDRASIPKDSEIRWVICVPSIWSDKAKQYMRTAALKAGLIKQDQSSQLLIVLEPSAAALYCRLQEANHFTGGPEAYENNGMEFRTGMKYIIVDAGGGTVDFTAQETIADDKVKELMVSNGGDWGGREVDQNFVSLLKDVLGTGYIDRFICECPLQWYDLLTTFEKAKKNIDKEGNGFNICIPAIFERMYFRWEKGDLSETINSFKDSKGISESNGYLRIDHTSTQQLFQPVLQKISDHLKNMLRSEALQNSDISYIFLVGGFSSCKLLHNYIKKARERGTILTPFDAQVAIVKGAVLYCNKPDTIKRLAKKTYGAASYVPFESTKHPESKKQSQGDETLCRDVFLPFFQKNEIIETGEKGTVVAEPVNNGADSVTIDFYSIDRRLEHGEVLFIDSKEVTREGSTRVDVPQISNNKEVLIEFHFGDETQVTATNTESGVKHEVKLNFQFSTGS